MHQNIAGHDLYWNEPSGWKFKGAGRSLAGGIGVAIPTPAIVVNLGASFGGTAWEFDLESTTAPHAKHLTWGGYYLPDWYRYYRFKVVGLTGSFGASTIGDVLIDATVSYGESSDPSGSIGSVLRQLGAPVPRDGQQNYEAGDPTGFLGVGTQTTGAIGVTNVRGMNGSLAELKMGSNITDLLRDRTPRWLNDNLTHVSSLFGGHLTFKYSTIHWGVGSDAFQVGVINLQASVELQFCYLALADLFVVQPKTGYSFYVYSMWLDEDNHVRWGEREHRYGRQWVHTVGNSGRHG